MSRALGLLVLLGVLAPAAAAQTPAGTEIRAAAEARYETPNGLERRAYSDTLVLVVAHVAGVDLEPPQSKTGNPASNVLFQHTLANIGNGTDSITVSATSRRGWSVRVFLVANDTDGSETAEGTSSQTTTLAAGDSVGVLVSVTIPSSETITGPADTIDVVATSLSDPTVSDQVQDLLGIQDAGITVSLEKRVDRASATVGDILTYTIEYHATGPNSATDFAIVDRIPDGTSYVPGTMHWNGTPQTDATGDDLGEFEVGNSRVVFNIGSVTGGDSGVVSFQVRVED